MSSRTSTMSELENIHGKRAKLQLIKNPRFQTNVKDATKLSSQGLA
jgi:hypothetical protein